MQQQQEQELEAGFDVEAFVRSQRQDAAIAPKPPAPIAITPELLAYIQQLQRSAPVNAPTPRWQQREAQPRSIPYVAMSAIIGCSVLIAAPLTAWIISSNSPNASMVALGSKALENRPNTTLQIDCGGFMTQCPDIPQQVFSGMTEPQMTTVSASATGASVGNVSSDSYSKWLAYWRSQPMSEVHQWASKLTPTDCIAQPGMCEAMNQIKSERIAQGEK